MSVVIVVVIMVVIVVWFRRIIELDSVGEFGAIDENWFTLVHNVCNVGLGVAVKLNDGAVDLLHIFLPVEAVFEV